MSIDFWKLDGTRFSTLPDLVSYNGYVKDANGDVYETKANSGIVSKKQFTYNLTANSSWLSGSGNAISNIAIGSDGSLTATKVNLDDRYFTEQEIKNSYIPWDTRWNGTGGGFYKDGNVFINGNGYSDYLTNILTGIKNSISGLGSIYAKIGDCYTKAESDGRYALKTELANKQDKLGFTPVQQGGGYLQGTNKIKIGWSGSELRCQVDNTDMGGIAFKSNISNATITIKQGDKVKGSFTLNGGAATINLDSGTSTDDIWNSIIYAYFNEGTTVSLSDSYREVYCSVGELKSSSNLWADCDWDSDNKRFNMSDTSFRVPSGTYKCLSPSTIKLYKTTVTATGTGGEVLEHMCTKGTFVKVS